MLEEQMRLEEERRRQQEAEDRRKEEERQRLIEVCRTSVLYMSKFGSLGPPQTRVKKH